MTSSELLYSNPIATATAAGKAAADRMGALLKGVIPKLF